MHAALGNHEGQNITNFYRCKTPGNILICVKTRFHDVVVDQKGEKVKVLVYFVENIKNYYPNVICFGLLKIILYIL